MLSRHGWMEVCRQRSMRQGRAGQESVSRRLCMLQAHAVWRMDSLDQHDQWQASPTAVSQLRASISLTSSAGAADSVVRSELDVPPALECMLRLTCGLQSYTDGTAVGVRIQSRTAGSDECASERYSKCGILNCVGSHATTGRPRPAPTLP